jgi:hypothetical protein
MVYSQDYGLPVRLLYGCVYLTHSSVLWLDKSWFFEFAGLWCLTETMLCVIIILINMHVYSMCNASFGIWIKWKCQCFNYDQHLICFCHTCIYKLLFNIRVQDKIVQMLCIQMYLLYGLLIQPSCCFFPLLF